MRKLAAWCHDRRRTVIGLWLAALLVAMALMAGVGGEYKNVFRLPGTESQRAYDLLKQKYPERSGDTADVVLSVEQGRVLDKRAEIERVIATIEKSPEVLDVADPFAQNAPVSRDGRLTFAQIQFKHGGGDVETKDVKEMTDETLELDGVGGLQVALGGDVIQWSSQEEAFTAELVGIVVAAIVLFITLGGVVAMGLPLLNAFFAMLVSTSLMLVAGTALVDTADWAPFMAGMIGIGVGIDYALLIINRFRLERGSGRDVRASTLVALNTSGRAVLFAGIVVVIAMLGMLLLGLSFLNGPAIAAALAVLLTMIGALTLMPALLGAFGHRIKLPKTDNGDGAATDLADRERGLSARWSQFVTRRPLPVAIVALAVLILLAIPANHMRLAFGDASTYKKDDTTRIAYDRLSAAFGPGFNGPLLLAVELPRKNDRASLDAIGAALREQDGIANVVPPQINRAGDTATMIAYPTTKPQDEATDDLVKEVRSDTLPPVEERTGARISIGGATATNLDFSAEIREKLPLFIGVVVGLSLLLLLVVFRSVLIPIKAGIFNLLSILGAFGVVTLVFQDGHLQGLFGLDNSGPIDSFLPIMVFAVVFGLSMDYEVFLVSRMHEEWMRTKDAHYATRHGLAMTGRVVTAAAIIMIVVFAGFAIGNQRALAEMGVGFASAIFIDAFIIRLLLLPAVMHLFGARMWWMPAWLEKRLPHLAIEDPDAAHGTVGAPPSTNGREGEAEEQAASTRS